MSLAILRDWVTLRLNFRVTFCANIYGPLDTGMVILQLCSRKFSHRKLLSSRLYSIEVDFY